MSKFCVVLFPTLSNFYCASSFSCLAFCVTQGWSSTVYWSRVSKPWHGTATSSLPSLLPFPLHFSTLPFCLQARQPHVSSAHRETEGTGCMFNALLWNPPLHLCLFMVNSVTLWLYYKCHSLLILWSSSVFLSTRKERQIYQIIPLCLLWSYTPL